MLRSGQLEGLSPVHVTRLADLLGAETLSTSQMTPTVSISQTKLDRNLTGASRTERGPPLLRGLRCTPNRRPECLPFKDYADRICQRTLIERA